MGTGTGTKKQATEMISARGRPGFISAAASWVIVDAPGLREIRSVSILEALCVLSFIVCLHPYRRRDASKCFTPGPVL